MQSRRNHPGANEEAFLEERGCHAQRQREQNGDDGDDQRFAGDEPPHLSWGAADGTEESELTVTLLHRERERAGDDEDRDEGGEDGEDRQAGDDVLAAQCVVGRFRVAALGPRQRPQTRAVKLRPNSIGDLRADPPRGG